MSYSRDNLLADRQALVGIDQTIRSLFNHRNYVCYRLNQYKYPVATLPNEVVSEIFLHCIPPYPSCPPLFGVGSPTKLAHISSSWRTIAHKTPALWRAVSIRSASILSASNSDAWAAAKSWLDRSASLPLSIMLDGRNMLGPAGHIAEIIDLLRAHCSRWEFIWFRDLPMDLNLQGAALPLLVEADVPHELGPRITNIVNCPRLSTAFIHGGDNSPIRDTPFFPWNQLTCFNLWRTSAWTRPSIFFAAVIDSNDAGWSSPTKMSGTTTGQR
ncbi:F-box domain-containing protein [Mycena kentingensis (nom. inval.)]|nr:F-box domain-containing protein [Mycena kentingensis (nom. inval.)]